MPTRRPPRRSAATSWRLCSGWTRAKTVFWSALWRSADASAGSSAPVVTRPSVSIPAARATAATVAGPSPEMILTSTPARCRYATVVAASGRIRSLSASSASGIELGQARLAVALGLGEPARAPEQQHAQALLLAAPHRVRERRVGVRAHRAPRAPPGRARCRRRRRSRSTSSATRTAPRAGRSASRPRGARAARPRSGCARPGWPRRRRAARARRGSPAPPSGSDLLHGERAVGERPGLVEADDVEAGERLDRGQALDERSAAADARGGHREDEARQQHEALGHERDDAGDGRRHGLAHGDVVRAQRVQQQDRDRDHDRDHQAQQPVDRELQRRELAAILARGVRELVGVRIGADALGLVDAAARDAERAGLELVAGAPRVGVGLARQDRLVDLEPAGLEQPPVGDDLVARAHDDRVADDDVVDRDDALGVVAQDARARGREQCQPVERPLRAHLLDDADARVDDEHRGEEQICELTRRDQRDRAGREDEVEQREQVAPDDRPVGQAAGRLLRRASLLEPARRLGRAETVRRHSRQGRRTVRRCDARRRRARARGTMTACAGATPSRSIPSSWRSASASPCPRTSRRASTSRRPDRVLRADRAQRRARADDRALGPHPALGQGHEGRRQDDQRARRVARREAGLPPAARRRTAA